MIFNHAVNTSTARKQLWQGTEAAGGLGPTPFPRPSPSPPAHLQEGAGIRGLCSAAAWLK